MQFRSPQLGSPKVSSSGLYLPLGSHLAVCAPPEHRQGSASPATSGSRSPLPPHPVHTLTVSEEAVFTVTVLTPFSPELSLSYFRKSPGVQVLSEAESPHGAASGQIMRSSSFHVTGSCVLAHPVLVLRGRHGVYVLPYSPLLPDFSK